MRIVRYKVQGLFWKILHFVPVDFIILIGVLYKQADGVIVSKEDVVMADELWDIYTKDRERTGRVHRRRDKMKAGEYHLVVHVCIFNSKNEMLVQQRQPFKEDWSNMWDLTAAGSALQGENSCQAAERELAEELGLKLDFSDKRANFTINFVHGFDDYFLLEQEVELASLHLQEEEVQAVRWCSKEEVLAMQEQGIMIPYWFLDKLFEVRGVYGAHGSR